MERLSEEISPKISRREFLRLSIGIGIVGSLSSACRATEALFQTPTSEAPTATSLPTACSEATKKARPTLTPRPTREPTKTFTSEPTKESLATFERVLVLKPGGFEATGGILPEEIQEYQTRLKTLEAAGMIPEAPEEGLSLLWLRSDSDSWALWATKIYSADEHPENSGVWVLKENQWQKKESNLWFVSGYKFYKSAEENLPPRYLGREKGEVSWVLERDALEDPAAQAFSPETGEKTGVAVFWTSGPTMTVFGTVPPYLPEGRVRVRAEYLAAPTFVLKEGELTIVMERLEDSEPVGWWNLEKGGWTPDKENGVEYKDLFEEPEPTPTPKPEEMVEEIAEQVREYYKTEERELALATLNEEGRDTWARGQSFWTFKLQEGIDPADPEAPHLYGFILGGRVLKDCGFDPEGRRVLLMSVSGNPYAGKGFWIITETNRPDLVPDVPEAGEWANHRIEEKIISSVPLLAVVSIEPNAVSDILRWDGLRLGGNPFGRDVQEGDAVKVIGDFESEAEYSKFLNEIERKVQEKPSLGFLEVGMNLLANYVSVWREGD